MTIRKSAHIISKKRSLQLTATAVSSALLLASATGMAADEAQKRTIKIEADAIEPAYKAETVSSPKFTQPLVDTPQTIQVITNEVFKQQGATTLAEALRNSPGVGTFFVGENGNTNTGDSVFMRGFDTSNSIFVDGVRDLGSVSRDLFNVEQVEVEKGPAGTDNGRSAPTGAINMATKQANLEDAVSASIDLGTDGQKRATTDWNQTLDGLSGSALRVNLMWQDSDVPGRDHVNNSRFGIAPSLGFGLDGNTRGYLNLLYVEQDNVPDGGVPTIALPGWTPQPGLEALVGHEVDPENFYGTAQDHDDITAKMATFRLEHDFSDAVQLSNILRWGQTTQDYLLTAFMSTSANISATDPADLSTYSLARSLSTFKDQENKILTDQLNLRMEFATGSVQHTVSTGLEWAKEQQDNHGVTGTGTRPAANLYNPSWSDTGNYSWARNGAISEGETTTTSIYLFDTAKFGEKFLLVGGLRLDSYDTEYYSNAVCGGTGRGAVACGSLPTGSIVETADLSDDDNLFNWKLGGIYKPVESGSIYVNYAVSQQPPGGSNFQLSSAANNANNPNLDPQEAETYELGTKWNLLDNALALNLALFRTTVTNEINSQILDINGNPTQTGEKQIQGVELSAIGNLTDNWSIFAGYSYLDTSVEEGPAVAQDGTDNLTYTPGNSFTAWTTYRFGSGLMLGGGAIYSGEMHRGTDGAVGTPTYTEAYTLVNAVASYEVTNNITLRVNINNLFDKEYVSAINKSGYRYTPGSPRTILIGADIVF